MLTVIEVVAPVFALIALGYFAVKWKFFPDEGIGGLIGFVNNFAAPALLFRAMLATDFASALNFKVILPYYLVAVVCLLLGTFVSRLAFKSRPGVAVASGFSAHFSNAVLVGIPILQRAYGDAALQVILTIIGFHALVLVTVGSLFMEIMRRDGNNFGSVVLRAGTNLVRNPMLWGITLGLIGNLVHLDLPESGDAFLTFLAQAVVPVSLFGLGGALNRYKLAGNWQQPLSMALIKLIVHPALAYLAVAVVLGVPHDIARYVVLLAAMPTGMNAYIFATYYNRGVDVVSNTILITNALSVVTISLWLLLMTI